MASSRLRQMSRPARLEAARRHLPWFSGRKGIRRYRRWFGVSVDCAAAELRMLGIDVPDARLEQARRDEASPAAHRRKKRQRRAVPVEILESDDEFAFIAGYTEGGAPYGVTREEMRASEAGPDLGPHAPVRMELWPEDDDLPF